MGAYDEILGALPVDDLAQSVGASPLEVQQAASAILPALLGGMSANARDSGGASSLLDALGQHDPALLDGGVDLSQVDQQDGQRIADHVFGDRQDDVVSRLGESPLSGQGVGGQLVRRLIPILAPMVLSWLAKQVLGGGRAGGSGGAAAPRPGDAPASAPGGGLQDVLGQVLGSATGGAAPGGTPRQAPTSGGVDAGSIIGDLLGGILGGGRR